MGGGEAESLRAALYSFNFWSGVATIVVAVGLFVELGTLFFFSKPMPLSERISLVLATLIILIGVAGEYEFGSQAADAAAALQRISDKAVTDAERDAKQAEQRAAEANLALAQFKAPRVIPPDAQQRIIAKVRPFSGVEFDIATLLDSEPLNLVEQIEATLSAAGWNEIDWSGESLSISRNAGSRVGISIETGITVIVAQQRAADLLPAAKALAEALSLEGIAAEAKFAHPSMPIHQNAINIAVGRKPVEK